MLEPTAISTDLIPIALQEMRVPGLGLRERSGPSIRISGNGRASKEQVQKTIQTILSLPNIPEPNDVADAIAAALCCANSINSIVI